MNECQRLFLFFRSHLSCGFVLLIRKGLKELEKFVNIVLIEVECRDEKLCWLFQIKSTEGKECVAQLPKGCANKIPRKVW